MKVPMKWLKEYVDINMPAEEYASRMVMTGTAVEGVEKTGEQFEKVVVGRVLSCVDHPNSATTTVTEPVGRSRYRSVPSAPLPVPTPFALPLS